VPRFGYDAAVLARFPSTVGAVLHATCVATEPSSSTRLADAFAAEQAATLARFGDTPLAEIESLAAWRRVFSGFGVEPTRYRNAAEALLRRLTKSGSIPALSPLVDVGNLVSIRYAIPVAVLDPAAIRGAITVRFARGDEPFRDLGSDTVEHPEPGEVVFVDEAGVVHARRWCWRQSAESATGVRTTEVLVAVEAHHPAARDDVSSALVDLERLLPAYTGASVVHAALIG
jgi:DNA/RNA-binding domain of Phe-tRNA-synthetase-like protein